MSEKRRIRFRSRLIGALLLPCLAFAAGFAPAAGDAERLQRVQELEGQAYGKWEAKDYAAALELYRQAHGVWRLPALTFMEARCLEALGRKVEAILALERALAESPDAELRGRVEGKLADLRDEVAKGSLILLVEPAGAKVLIDGKPRGEAPLPPLELPPGTYRVDVEHPDYYAEERSVRIEGGRQTTAKVVLNPLPKVEEEGPPLPPWYDSTWGWVTAGTGLVSATVAAALLVVAEQEHQAVRDLRDEAPDIRSTSQKKAFDRWEKADQMQIAGYALVGVGGAALAVSAVLFATYPDRAATEEEVITFNPTPLPGGGGVIFGARF